MWRYDQLSGALSHDGEVIAHGYAGLGADKNNPASEGIKGKGPLPRGAYVIGVPHTSAHVGLYAMCLTPAADNAMHGRSAFLIHGENAAHPGASSNGCMIFARATRQAIWTSGDHQLVVA